MPQPQPYDRQFNFADQQAQTPTTPLPAQEVDAELNAVKLTLDQTLTNLAKLQRDDGALKNGIVTQDSLSSSLSIGFTFRGTWQTATNYVLSDGVSVGSIFYKAKQSHLSSGANQPPNAAFWDPIADITPLAIGPNSVSTAALQDGSVTTAKIADANVTTAALQDGSVTTAKIADANVTTAALQDGSVTTAKIADASVTAAKLAGVFGTPVNISLAASVGSNALTISLTDAAGSAPSAASPVVIPFRSATAANGNLASRVLTGATTLVISSGSTMGFANATAGRLWIVAFDDAGTVRLGAVNCRSGVNIFPLAQFGIASSTAEGGAGAADSAHVFYTGTAVTSKAYTVLGYLEWAAGLTTAGTWAIVPTRIDTFKPGMKLPGDVVQARIETNNTYATNGANVIPADNTEPQNTEGDAISTLAFTPSSSANVLDVSTSGQIGSIVANTGVALTICRSDQSNCIASGASYIETAGGYVLASLQQYVVAGATSSVDFTNRYGPFAAGSGRSINGGASVRQFGASQAFVLKVKEIVA